MIVLHFCVDINECSANTHACSQLCVNDLGTYHCECFNGYQKRITTPTDGTCTGKYYLHPLVVLVYIVVIDDLKCINTYIVM